jgi:hypothetical protein
MDFKVTENIKKDHDISQEQTIEIKILLNIILEQYYIEHNRKWYKQKNCLTMGTHTSTILAEVLIKHLKHTVIVCILKKFQATDYNRYVNNILILYNTHTAIITPYLLTELSPS